MEDNGNELLPDGLGTGLVTPAKNPTIIEGAGKNNNPYITKVENKDDAAAAAAKLEADKKAQEEATKAKEEADKKAKEQQSKEGQNSEDQIEIDGVVFNLDKDGNAVDKDGKVFKTAKEIESLAKVEEETSLIEDITKQLGIEVKDEKGQPIIFEDSVEGIAAYVKAVKEQEALRIFNERINADEELKKFIEFRQRGGNLKDFATRETQSWQKVKLSDDEGQQLDIVEQDLIMAGMSEAQAKLTAQMYKDTNRLKEFSTESLKRLQTFEKESEEEEKATFEATIKKQQENNKNYWDNVNKVIKNGKLKDFTIPENIREDFFKHIAVAIDKNGRSQFDKEWLEMPVEQRLEIQLFQFLKGDLSKLVKNAATTAAVKSLKSRIKDNQDLGNGKGIKRENFGKSTADKFPSLDKLF